MSRLSHALIVSLLTSTSALAAPATPEEAARLTALFQSYVGDAAGVFSVTPNGEVYDVKVDAKPLIDKMPVKTGEDIPAVTITPWQFQIADQGVGKWLVTQDKPFEMNVKAVGQLDLTMKIGSVNYAGTFDSNLKFFTASKADFGDLSFSEKMNSPETGQIDIVYSLKSMHYESANREAAPGSVDGEGKLTFAAFHEALKVAPTAEGQTPLDLTIDGANGSQDVAFKGFRMTAAYDLISWFFKNAPQKDKKLDAAKQEELKVLLEAGLPIFNNINMKGAIEGITVASAYGQFGLGKIETGIEMNGLVKDGLFRETVVLEKLTMPDGIVPPFANDFIPDRLAFDVKVTGFDADAPARLALADMSKLAESGSTPEFDAKLSKALMPTGAVTVTVNNVAAAGKTYDLTLDGSMAGGPEVKPTGKGAIHAKSLMPLINAIAALPEELGMGMASTGLIAFNAMAKKQPDGSLLWDLEGTADGKFLINGVDYAALANIGGNAVPDQDPEMNQDQSGDAPADRPDAGTSSDEDMDGDAPGEDDAGGQTAPKQ